MYEFWPFHIAIDNFYFNFFSQNFDFLRTNKRPFWTKNHPRGPYIKSGDCTLNTAASSFLWGTQLSVYYATCSQLTMTVCTLASALCAIPVHYIYPVKAFVGHLERPRKDRFEKMVLKLKSLILAIKIWQFFWYLPEALQLFLQKLAHGFKISLTSIKYLLD